GRGQIGPPIDQGLGDVATDDAPGALEVGDGAGQPQGPGPAARGQGARLPGPDQQRLAGRVGGGDAVEDLARGAGVQRLGRIQAQLDRKSTRLNSSHVKISYA